MPNETADVVVDRVARGPTVTKVDTTLIKAQTGVRLYIATFLLTIVTDVVDDRPRSLGGVGSRRTTTNTFDLIHRCVKAGPVVIVAKLNIAKQDRGQPIFLNLNKRRTAGRDRKTTYGDIGVTARPGGTRHLNPRNHPQHLRLGAGLKILNGVGIYSSYRDGAFNLGSPTTGRGRDQDLFQGWLLLSLSAEGKGQSQH